MSKLFAISALFCLFTALPASAGWFDWLSAPSVLSDSPPEGPFSSWTDCREQIDQWNSRSGNRITQDDYAELCSGYAQTPYERCEQWRASDRKWFDVARCTPELAEQGKVLYLGQFNHSSAEDIAVEPCYIISCSSEFEGDKAFAD